ncbi:hypothetical protein [Ancylobacter oerskovii]|uniref:Uncharacterized protein n=1 Tax=Ancylobacter oerskovii TaxID=459519 RepID=A0ABW4YU70_9HYPH|nr:hypothetical protein [Ancylobacter oerskovii]
MSPDAIDRINITAEQRYRDALRTRAANAHPHAIHLLVSPAPFEQGFTVRLADEIDAFTISEHPIEAAGWLLWHVRGHLDTPIVVDCAVGIVRTNVLNAKLIADEKLAAGIMERPVALQHLSTSAFREFPQ